MGSAATKSAPDKGAPKSAPEKGKGGSGRGGGGRFKDAELLVELLALPWIVEAVDHYVFSGGLDAFGLIPRHVPGLRGVVLAPFLHAGFAQLAANTVPLAVLGGLLMLRGREAFLKTTAWGGLLAYFLLWIFGEPVLHLGAGGLIFAYTGYLLFLAVFERKPVTIALSLLVAVLYAGVLIGSIPLARGFAWEGHLAGFIAGIAVAWRETKA